MDSLIADSRDTTGAINSRVRDFHRGDVDCSDMLPPGGSPTRSIGLASMASTGSVDLPVVDRANVPSSANLADRVREQRRTPADEAARRAILSTSTNGGSPMSSRAMSSRPQKRISFSEHDK